MTKRVIVLTNGHIEDPDTIRARLEKYGKATVIAANGGSVHAETLGLPLHAIVGDLDSLSEKTTARLLAGDILTQKSSPEKDETDLELALLYAADQGAEEMIIIGALGGRIDMSIGNLLLMTHPRLTNIHIQLWNGSQTAWIIRPPGDEIHGQAGDTLSLIPLITDAKGVTTKNLAYPLNDEPLPAGFSRGLSNVLTEATAIVKLKEGFLLAVHTPGRA